MGVEGLVDAMLQEASQLLGSGPPPSPQPPAPPSPPPAWPQWEGPASDQARQVSTHLTDQRTSLHLAQVRTTAIVNDAATITTDARPRLAGIQAEWERDKAAMAPFANTPNGQAVLAQAGQARLQEATGVVHDAAS